MIEPRVTDAGGVYCPSCDRPMVACVGRFFETSGRARFLWWRCPVGCYATQAVPIPKRAVA